MSEASVTLSDTHRAASPHARRRPGLVALLYAYRALAGLLVALPAAVAAGGPTSGWPRGQAELLDPGGVMLIESLRLSRRALLPVEISAGAVAAVALVAGVFPLAVLLAGLSREGRLSGAALAARAWASAGTLALVAGLGLLLQALVCGVTAVLGGKLLGALHLVPPADDLASAALLAGIVAIGLATGVLRDLASAAAVRGGHGLYVACSRALRCARRAGGRALLAWAWRGSLGLAGLALAAWLTPRGASAAAVAGAVVLHQAAIAGATFARASWLAAAMRLYDATEPAPAGDVAKAEDADGGAPVLEASGEAPAVEAVKEPEGGGEGSATAGPA